ncbi:MAG: hypothetical protein V1929_05880 [bacterium]
MNFRAKFVLLLFVVVCGILAFVVLNSKQRPTPSSEPVSIYPPSETTGAEIIASVSEVDSKATTAPRASVETASVTSTGQPTVPILSVLPTNVAYAALPRGRWNDQLSTVFNAASNAVSSVDRILREKNYTVHEFSRTVWFVSEDHAQSTAWRIFPYPTNGVIGSVEATVFQDRAMTQKDLSSSFEMHFFPDGTLQKFWWADKHEIVRVNTNEPHIEYAKRLDGKVYLQMQWDANGDLASSNVYDWAKRGRVIGGTQSVVPPIHRLGPTSAEEAVTGAWRDTTNTVPPQPPTTAPTSP